MSIETIKSYLISLGFAVENKSFNDAKKAMEATEKAIGDLALTATGKLAIAGAGVTAFAVVAGIGLAKFTSDLATADMEMQKFARRMFITLPNAYSLRSTMKAMGLNSIEDLKDVALNTELRERFQKLRSQSYQMMPQGDFEMQMRKVRDIQFEFSRLKLESIFAFQQIGGAFMKYMGGPLGNFQQNFKKFNDYITKTMPHWTDQIGHFLSIFGRLSMALVQGLTSLLGLFDRLPGLIKLITAAAIALNIPFMKQMALISGLLLLLDDYFTFMNGGKSLFSAQWGWIEKGKKGRTAATILGAGAAGAWAGGRLGALAGPEGVPIGAGIGGLGGIAAGTAHEWNNIKKIFPPGKNLFPDSSPPDPSQFPALPKFTGQLKNLPSTDSLKGYTNNTQIDNRKINININGAGDPKTVADKVMIALEMRNMQGLAT